MASIAPGRRRKRNRRGKRELTELDWGDGHRGTRHQSEEELAFGEEEEDWDRNWDEDWEDSEDWGPPPGLWEEDELD